MLDDLKKIVLDPGLAVYCDCCSKDFTDLPDKGGFYFSNQAVCPDCEPRFMKKVRQFNEENHIKHRCPQGMSFRDFVYDLRAKGL